MNYKVISKVVTAIKDFEMLQSGEWNPDHDSCQASIDNLDSAVSQLKEPQIKQLMSSVELTNSDWQDQVDSLNAEDVGLLMYKLIEKNVTHDATQRHMMYDVLSALEQHID
mgnify:FL=1|jgi:hypothetical protein